MFEKFLQSNLEEIKQNKIRFAAVAICFSVAVILLLTDENSAGEEINLTENPAPVENAATDKKIIPVKDAKISAADKNITVVLGANSENLYVHDPFKFPPEEKVEEIAPVEIPKIPEVQPVIITPPPPVAQDSNKPEVKIILRGTAIIGDKKSALIQVISDKNSAAENLIFEVGEILNGKKISNITQDYLTFDDGEILYLDILSP